MKTFRISAYELAETYDENDTPDVVSAALVRRCEPNDRRPFVPLDIPRGKLWTHTPRFTVDAVISTDPLVVERMSLREWLRGPPRDARTPLATFDHATVKRALATWSEFGLETWQWVSVDRAGPFRTTGWEGAALVFRTDPFRRLVILSLGEKKP